MPRPPLLNAHSVNRDWERDMDLGTNAGKPPSPSRLTFVPL